MGTVRDLSGGLGPHQGSGLSFQVDANAPDKSLHRHPMLIWCVAGFTADRPNMLWSPILLNTDEGKLYLASVLDLCGRRLLA